MPIIGTKSLFCLRNTTKYIDIEQSDVIWTVYLALCQELGLSKNNKDADAVKGKLALDCIVAFKRLQKT